jgi:hypothetical protein
MAISDTTVYSFKNINNISMKKVIYVGKDKKVVEKDKKNGNRRKRRSHLIHITFFQFLAPTSLVKVHKAPPPTPPLH